jgi:hypothetical protein
MKLLQCDHANKVYLNQGDDDDEASDERRARIASGTSSPEKNPQNKDMAKRKHSISAHLQAELNKQKILRAKQERETRRADLDTQHIYLMEIVATHLDLRPKDVEEFVIDSQDFLDILNSFFERKGAKAVMFCYQDSDPPGPESGRPIANPGGKKERMKRVLVSNGRDIPVRGPTLFFMRNDNERKINIKNINDEVYFGMLNFKNASQPGFILNSVYTAMESIYLKYLSMNNTWISITDPETASLVRLRFLNSVEHYADFLAGELS